ncbi:MAG: pilus assembly protein N-terminal domain-containing protein [Thermodesulfobacteriota bacterium]
MKKILLALAFALAFLPFPAHRESRGEEFVRLLPGFQKILDRKGVSRLSVGNPEIIEAQPLPKGDGILLVGKKEGETDLVLWEKGIRKEWRVEVGSRKNSWAEEIRQFAGSFPGLTVTEAGGAVIVGGTVATSREKRVLEDFARSRPGIHLQVSLPEEKKTLLDYDLKIIEIGRGESAKLGVQWPESIPFKTTFATSSGSGKTVSLGTEFDASLNLLLAHGKARILTNPRLACESGEEASFLAGGEIPIVIITPETRKVEWKTYGIILKIHPTMAPEGKIRTSVTAEVSSVDHASGSADVPAFLTRRVSTHFSTSPGETVMLSGLVKNEMAKDISKVPLLGQIPVLGELFKSRSFRENLTELAIFITPKEVAGGSAPEVAEWEKKSAMQRDAVRFRLLD